MITLIIIVIGIMCFSLAIVACLENVRIPAFICGVGALAVMFLAGASRAEDYCRTEAVKAGAAEWVVLTVNEDGSTETEFKWKVEEQPKEEK